MAKTFFTKRNIILAISTILLFGLIGFVEKKSSEKIVKNVIINIKDEYGSHFIDEGDIMKTVSVDNFDSIQGMDFNEVNLKAMERRIESNRFVNQAEVYKDHKGNIIIDITQRRPIARIVQEDHPHAYLDKEGNVFPISEKFTARVVIVDGDNAKKFLDSAYRKSDEAKAVMSMLNIVDQDPFLKAQISQVTLRKNGEVELMPQVGDEVILFGKPDDLEIKFKKCKIFYKKIIQLKGYNKYKIVNLKYKDQIICE